ncbi:MAG: BON domain-containing protein [Nitrosomonadaceae bacterium]
MKPLKNISFVFITLVLATMLGCGSSPKHESTGEYLDDSVITMKIKASLLQEPSLKSTEIHVETFKGQVQLSGFVGIEAHKSKAVEVAGKIKGVRTVINDMRIKDQ